MEPFQKPYFYGSKCSNVTFITLSTHVWLFSDKLYLKTFVLMYSIKCNSLLAHLYTDDVIKGQKVTERCQS